MSNRIDPDLFFFLTNLFINADLITRTTARARIFAVPLAVQL